MFVKDLFAVVSSDDDVSTLDHSKMDQATEEIQNHVLGLLNRAIAEKVTASMLSLRETYIGTLQR